MRVAGETRELRRLVSTLRHLRFTVVAEGQGKTQSLWRHHHQGANGLIFAVDSNDGDRTVDATEDFNNVCNEDEMFDAVVLELRTSRTCLMT